MKKAGSRILIITFGIMAAIAILYPWKFVPEYGILQMTESGEKAGKTAESQESDEEYMQVADRAVEALFTGDTDTLLSLLPERYFGQYGETLQWIIENAVEEELQKLQDEVGDIQITHWPVRSEKQSEGNMETRLLRGPRIFLEEQILDEIKGMYTKGAKGRVTVTRPIQWFSQIEQTWVQRENRIDFEVGA